MRKRNKKLLRFSLKVTYLLGLLLLGFELYSRVDAGAWQYFVGVGVAFTILKLYSFPRMVFEYIDSNTESKSRRRVRG